MLLSGALYQKRSRELPLASMQGGRRWEGREEVDKFRVRALAAAALCNFCCLEIGRSC